MRLGVVRGVSYGLFGPPTEFGPQARAVGAGLVRAYVYWGQVEPRPGEYTWDTVDALMRQLNGDEEVWITVVSSSRWATRTPTDFLPPSPARDPAAYGEFIRRLVHRCGGRVRMWQCDNEPSNIGLTWAGTAAEYVTQLRAMHAAVRDADPRAEVVLGGCGYDVLSSPPGSPQRQFFDEVCRTGRDAFDLFSVNLYGDPHRVPDDIAQARAIAGEGTEIVAGEHGGPMLFEFPAVEAALHQVMTAATLDTQDTGELRARMAQETPERRAMRALYARMPELPAELRMLMAGCAPALEARRHRIAARQLVMRTLLALSCGVRRMAYWCLAPEVPGTPDHLQMMHLLTGKLALLDYEGTTLAVRHPAANTFALLAAHLNGATRVTRLDAPDQPELYAFRIERPARGPLLVLWQRRDTFSGEDEPPAAATWPWDGGAEAVDAFGDRHEVTVDGGRLRLAVDATPVLISESRDATSSART
ncbi:hypothetical protein ABT369_06290 [Dactylosporangium sp. NPDC000244]|uniref:hypothetical protein n=1 Tax=Dactylosporangium sp. NPDC000244 TaxID=3154365 RepID=UPI00331E2663